jgi:DNA-binding transcriptional MerR regulator
MDSRRTIGRLAKDVGVGVETIRFHERQGFIVQPRKFKGPRHHDGALVRLRYLCLAQRLGFGLKENREL